MKNIKTSSDHAGTRALLFPTRAGDIQGKPVFYLFSVRQVAEVLTHVTAHPVPLASAYAPSVAHWRGRVLPILSLEQCLGIKQFKDQTALQTIVLRGVTQDNKGQLNELYAICKVGTGVQQLAFPLECKPIAVPDEVTNATCLHGAYEMQKRLLLVINLEKILNTNILEELACTKNQP